jgi:hypothetical protein
MYGKKRIVIDGKGLVSRTGGKSHFGIGRYVVDGDKLVARILRPEHKFDHQLNDANSVTITATSKTELRQTVKTLWAKELA